MKVMFDTNVYISYIRSGHHADEMERRGTLKYIAGAVLMELWAGAKTKSARRFLHKNLHSYIAAGRVVALTPESHIKIGKFLCDLPKNYVTLIRQAGFLNDVYVAFMALSIGAVLYTEDKDHFEIIGNGLRHLKIEHLQA